MLSKSVEKIYKEAALSTAGVSFNTNDSMVVSGNKNGDVIIRNLLNPEGNANKAHEVQDGAHQSGIAEVILLHSQKESDRCEVT